MLHAVHGIQVSTKLECLSSTLVGPLGMSECPQPKPLVTSSQGE